MVRVTFTQAGAPCGALVVSAWEVGEMIAFAARQHYGIELERLS